MRLRRILLNLVRAIKFTDRGSVLLEAVTRSAFDEGVEVQFSVEDTGIGGSADKQRLIFEAFRQANGSTAGRYGGRGSRAGHLVAISGSDGGTIWLESEVGRGSCFHLTMPLWVTTVELPCDRRRRWRAGHRRGEKRPFDVALMEFQMPRQDRQRC